MKHGKSWNCFRVVRRAMADWKEETTGLAIELAGMVMEGIVSNKKKQTFHVSRIAGKLQMIIDRERAAEKKQVATKEIVICAAIRTKDGTVIRGHRHGDCMYTAMRMRYKKQDLSFTDQGFVTSRNRYVSREEGRKLQDAAGIKSAAPEGYVADTLFSEDLY